MARPITSRKLDLLYLTFFIVHIPVMLFVDLQPYYPEPMKPQFTIQLRDWYIDTYHDLFFTQPTSWFHTYAVLEAVYHLPLSVWAIRALLRENPQVPLQLLIFAMETAVTTLTCVVEMLSWEGYTREEQANLLSLYVPYLLLAVVMGVDMFVRLRKILAEHETDLGYKKWM